MKNLIQRNENALLPASRREFLKLVSATGVGLTLGMHLPRVLAAGDEESALSPAENDEFQPNAFIRIQKDDQVVVIIKHLEMGQGTYTGLATLVAEELDADWMQVHSEGAPADASRYNNLLWGEAQGTGGSSSIANSFLQMRKAGAAAKSMLIAAAAEKWQVPAADIEVSKGVVSHQASERQAGFGELAALAAKQAVPDMESITLKDPKDFIYIGKNKLARKDRGKTDGTAQFTQDVKLDGMLTAVVAHAPRFGGAVRGFKAEKALASKGVVDVVNIPTGIAVLATDFWSAKKGRDLLEIDWDESQAFTKSTAQQMAQYKALAKEDGLIARNDGDTAGVLGQGAEAVEAEFEFPYLAHAAMEPMNCVALVKNQACEIWNGEQMHTGDQYAIAGLLGIKPENVTINMMYAGGSFGRRANPHSDYVVEAVNIAKAKPGTPVKLVWTREDDTRAGYYRPMYYHKIKGAVDKDGKAVAWEQTIVGQSIAKGTPFESFMIHDGIDHTSVEGAATMPYKIPNLRVDLHTVDEPVPVLWWRSVGHTHTAFTTETFIDRLAEAAGKDPVEFRLQLLDDHPRHRGVLQLVAEKSDWGSELPEGWGRGVAVHESFNSFAAEVAEVSVQEGGKFKVERIVCAIDCGVAVNPDIVRAQMESGIGFGLSPVLLSAITFDQGRVVQSNFHDYQVLRLDQMPEIEVHIVPSAEPPTGVGEPGVPPVAPAVANALSAVTGQRFSKLPLQLS